MFNTFARINQSLTHWFTHRAPHYAGSRQQHPTGLIGNFKRQPEALLRL